MSEPVLGGTISAGMATAIGSLPHRDAHAAAALTLRCLPELPAVPQLPLRSAREGVVAQWAGAVSGVVVHDDGAIEVTAAFDPLAPLQTTFDHATHAGLLTFLEVAARQPRPPRRVKVQIAGPLTLGTALAAAGIDADLAFSLGANVARAWTGAIADLVAARLPGAAVLCFLDEPALVRWRDSEAPIDREVATDLLSTALAACTGVSGVHVCGQGDLRLALDAGPQVVHFDVGALDLDDAATISRFLDGGGWIAWGAIPTHRPVGEQAQPLWKALLDAWCELTRRGCDPVQLRAQALVAPACGLAGHGASQAERAMLLAREIGNRVHDHAAATKLAVGA
jgi:Cobalamin-independent synthase, Catalytic domain